jgi:hypothetical protein
VQALVDDRLRVNQLAGTVSSWVASALTRCLELDDGRVLPPALGARAAVLAIGDELVPLADWRTAEGRSFASRHLLPLAQAALCSQLQELARRGASLQL